MLNSQSILSFVVFLFWLFSQLDKYTCDRGVEWGPQGRSDLGASTGQPGSYSRGRAASPLGTTPVFSKNSLSEPYRKTLGMPCFGILGPQMKFSFIPRALVKLAWVLTRRHTC